MQTKYFGIMLDCSRNGIMNMDGLKKFIDTIHSFGYNMLQLYTEDTFEVDNEEYFGYLRGRYSKAELKEIDAYCKVKGIELIPCIQTLAHLNQMFRWSNEYDRINDVNDILLVDDERTYTLIENIIKTVRECFTSDILHIGMDEAHMLGLGKYLDLHGYKNRYEILNGHLEKVIEIAKKYGFKPIMWSDMYFRLINHGNYYFEQPYDKKELEDVAKQIPKGVGQVYWDYYNTDRKMYDRMFKAHKILTDDVWFAGGAWTWTGFAPANKHTKITMLPAMKECKKHGINKIMFTMWGDNGTECSRYGVLPSLYLLKRTYDGENDLKKIKAEFKQITGEDFDAMMALDEPNLICKTKNTSANPAKYVLYNDVMLGYIDALLPEGGEKDYKRCARRLARFAKQSKNYGYVFDTLAKLSDLDAYKYTFGKELRAAYQAGDREKLAKSIKTIDVMLKKLNAFHSALRKQWYIENKPFGFEVQDMRIGGVMRRLLTVKDLIKEYLDGKLTSLPELDEKLLDYRKDKNQVLRFNDWLKIASVGSNQCP